MSIFYLEMIEGPYKGTRYRIDETTQIGRTKGDILVPDSKISASHAKVQVNEEGRFVLVDNKSSNGILINQVRVPRVTLMPGVIIQLGRTFFRVLEETAPIQVPLEELNWQERLLRLTENIQLKEEEPVAAISAFDPAITLTFIQGIQTDTIWTLGYGPRRVGSGTLDLILEELEAPELAFTLSPIDGKGLALFETSKPERVRINGQNEEKKALLPGDEIWIGSTRILVGQV